MRQAVIQTNAGLLSTRPLATNFNQNTNCLIHKNASANIVCKKGGHFVQGGEEVIRLWRKGAEST